MEALFSIGKEIGELRARLDKLESERCGCKGGRKGAEGGEKRESELTAQERATLAFLRERHEKIVEVLNKALESAGVKEAAGGPLYIHGFTLGVSPAEKRDLCCLCCINGRYCCAPLCTCCG